jgi:hypothetical protein
MPLWPSNLEIQFDIPIPAPVAALLGKNQLPTGELRLEEDSLSGDAYQHSMTGASAAEESDVLPSLHSEFNHLEAEHHENPKDQSEPMDDSSSVVERLIALDQRRKETQKHRSGLDLVDEVFQKISQKIKRPEIARQDGRFPVYVILSSKEGLESQYGPQTAQVVDEEMKKLSDAVSTRPGWRSLVFYPDDPESMVWLGLDPIAATDPWKIKLAIVDLDEMLSQRGEMIGALLIVGGADVVPFHKLPNPTDDIDEFVISDNPYATLDSNYFVPEWPVGRMPGESGRDAGLILGQLRNANDYHLTCIEPEPWWERLIYPFDMAARWLKRIIDEKLSGGLPEEAFGYSAAIWRRSSIAVFRPIGEANQLQVSPPSEAGKLKSEKVSRLPLGYYNLHGIEDGPNWYGQRDVGENELGPDYPVALRPHDVKKNGRAPLAVFTEACYGSNILEKVIDDALCLKFISIGTRALIGSTGIAYGSIITPLIAADLLGYLFWKFHRENLTVGEAFMRAKIELAREMNRRQAFLDGEDQKTLLSFVLYGDPLFGEKRRKSNAKNVYRPRLHPNVKTVTDHQEIEIPAAHVSGETLTHVKKTLEGYLPGLQDGEVRFSHQFAGYKNPDFAKDNVRVEKQRKDNINTGNIVVTVSKQVKGTWQLHRHYARMTLDPNGKMVKLAVSR